MLSSRHPQGISDGSRGYAFREPHLQANRPSLAGLLEAVLRSLLARLSLIGWIGRLLGQGPVLTDQFELRGGLVKTIPEVNQYFPGLRAITGTDDPPLLEDVDHASGSGVA